MGFAAVQISAMWRILVSQALLSFSAKWATVAFNLEGNQVKMKSSIVWFLNMQNSLRVTHFKYSTLLLQGN